MGLAEENRRAIGAGLRVWQTEATLNRPASGQTYNPANATLTGTAAPLSEAVTGQFTNFSRSDRALDGVERGDLRFALSAMGLDMTPEIGDTLTAGGITYKVVDVEPIGMPVPQSYVLQLRGP